MPAVSRVPCVGTKQLKNLMTAFLLVAWVTVIGMSFCGCGGWKALPNFSPITQKPPTQTERLIWSPEKTSAPSGRSANRPDIKLARFSETIQDKPAMPKSEQIARNEAPHFLNPSCPTLPNLPRSIKFRKFDVFCPRLFAGDELEMKRAEAIMQGEFHDNSGLGVYKFLRDPSSLCNQFVTSRGYIQSPVTTEENLFPIAFSIIAYKDIDRVERLLRAIYRPQNFYCIHVDLKSVTLLKFAKRLVSCFDNVFLSSTRVDVQWGHMSVLEPELICMRDLLKYKWKYFINLTGQEFPLKTNWQLVKILKSYRGANDIGGSHRKFAMGRVRGKDEPPHNITLTKGAVHISASRAFVEYLLRERRIRDFLAWLDDTKIPDETFFSSVNHNPHLGAPGAYKGPAETTEPYVSANRYKLWPASVCYGKRLRKICIFNVRDLPGLAASKELFANKFLVDYGQIAYNCLEELHWNRTLNEYRHNSNFNTSYYENLPLVTYRTNIQVK